jgi:hypothetical protein
VAIHDTVLCFNQYNLNSIKIQYNQNKIMGKKMQKDWRDFKSLYGNIEGAREGFEKACETLFRKVYYPQYVSQMAVKQGDGGIDVFVGEFGIKPISVIQCKFFLESFGDSQKSQIRESFSRAKNTDNYKLKGIPYKNQGNTSK